MTTQLEEAKPGAQPCGQLHGPDDECGACYELAITAPVPPTLGSVLAANVEEVADDLAVIEGNTLLELESGAVETSKLIAFADRLLARLAGDEAEATDVTAAMKAEVTLITTRYERLSQSIAKRAGWKRFCLEQLASLLFPDAKAKKKSITLPYGTLGRKDYAPTYKLVDEAAAVALAKRIAPDKVKLTIESDLAAFELAIVALIQTVEKKGTINGSVREFIDSAVAGTLGTTTGFLELKWGAVKKEPAVGLYVEGRGGVEEVPARAVFYSEITEG